MARPLVRASLGMRLALARPAPPRAVPLPIYTIQCLSVATDAATPSTPISIPTPAAAPASEAAPSPVGSSANLTPAAAAAAAASIRVNEAPTPNALARASAGRKTPEQLAALPYVVLRTSSDELPVYVKRKGGGSLKVVLLKHAHGNLGKLLEGLVADLKVEKSRARINPVTRHIEIKGNYSTAVKKWLTDAGF